MSKNNNNNKRKQTNWAAYLRNKNATKNPKVFNISLMRDQFGSFTAMGGQSLMLSRQGGKDSWVQVNTRDIVKLINENGINCL